VTPLSLTTGDDRVDAAAQPALVLVHLVVRGGVSLLPSEGAKPGRRHRGVAPADVGGGPSSTVAAELSLMAVWRARAPSQSTRVACVPLSRGSRALKTSFCVNVELEKGDR
jgi:hypothetical protein